MSDYFLSIADEAINVHGAMQKRAELAALLALTAGLRPRVVYEIGSATGGTLWALARVTPGTDNLYVSVDLPGGPFSGGATIDADALTRLIRWGNWPASEGVWPEPHVTVLRDDSRTVKIPDEPPELLLIDGDHSYEGVKADWERWGPLVPSGGIVAFHDILPHPEVTGVEVAKLWAEIAATETTVELVDPTDLGPAGNQWGGIGVVFR